MSLDNNVSRLGQSNLTGDVDALFLKVFSGEVLTTFEENNIMMPLHRVRTISSGKTAQFPTTGVAEAKYHTPGESLFGNEYDSGNTDPAYLSRIKHAERTISIDGVLTASAFLADIDEAKNHYEVRSIYSTEIGRQLAYHADRAIMHTFIAGARATSDRFTASGGSWSAGNKYLGAEVLMAQTANAAAASGSELVADNVTLDLDGNSTAVAVTGENIVKGLFTVARLMDEKNVAQAGRYCVLNPTNYYKLVNEDKDVINRDFGNDGNGSLAQGNIVSVAGISILKSNHVPNTNLAGSLFDDAAINNNPFNSAGTAGYSADFTGTEGVVFQTEGVGTVKLMDLAMESEYFMERLGTMMMAKYAMGHGILREECCYTLKTAQGG